MQRTSGRIHAALDVTDPEPLPDGHPLFAMPNVLMGDHLRRYAAGEPLINVVTGEY